MENIFEEIYMYYKNYLYTIIFDVIRDEQYAEDALQETFIKIFKNADKIENVKDNKTKRMVSVIAKNTAIDFYRKRKKQFENEAEYEKQDMIADKNAFIDMDSGESELLIAISRLTDKYRNVLLLKYSSGFSNEEIAEIMGISVVNVRKIISRGKKQLNDIYYMQKG